MNDIHWMHRPHRNRCDKNEWNSTVSSSRLEHNLDSNSSHRIRLQIHRRIWSRLCDGNEIDVIIRLSLHQIDCVCRQCVISGQFIDYRITISSGMNSSIRDHDPIQFGPSQLSKVCVLIDCRLLPAALSKYWFMATSSARIATLTPPFDAIAKRRCRHIATRQNVRVKEKSDIALLRYSRVAMQWKTRAAWLLSWKSEVINYKLIARHIWSVGCV